MANVFEGGGVRLRPMELGDAEFFYAIENDSDEWGTSLFFTPRSLHFLREYVNGASNDLLEDKQLRLIVERASDGVTLGIVDLFDYDIVCARAEVGVFVLREFRGNGYAMAALRLMVDYAFTYFRLSQVYAFVNETNADAARLFRRLGFEETAVLRRWFCFKGAYYDARLFQLLS